MTTELYCASLVLLLLHLALVLLHTQPVSAHRTPHKHAASSTKRKSHDFVSSGSGHLETLSWAVKLSFDAELYTTQELDMVADLVALETGLDNTGQISEFKGHYYLVHKFHQHTTKHITSSYHSQHNTSSNTSSITTDSSTEDGIVTQDSETVTVSPQSQNLTDAEWWQVKESTHLLLDQHPYVAWHMQQLVRSRQKRSLLLPREEILVPDFDDPAFPKQWHLVLICSFAIIVEQNTCTLIV